MRASEVAGFPLVAVVALVGCWFDFISGIFRYLSENAVHQSDHIYIYVYSMRIGTFKVSVGGVHPSRPFSFPKGSRTGVLFFSFLFCGHGGGVYLVKTSLWTGRHYFGPKAAKGIRASTKKRRLKHLNSGQ